MPSYRKSGPRDAERGLGALSATATSRNPVHRCHRGATANRISATVTSTCTAAPPLRQIHHHHHHHQLLMALAPQSGPTSSMSREGSRTAVIVQDATEQCDASDGALAPPAGTLRLRGGPRSGPRVAWDEAVVDNEGLGRKKSKSTCCAL